MFEYASEETTMSHSEKVSNNVCAGTVLFEICRKLLLKPINIVNFEYKEVT